MFTYSSVIFLINFQIYLSVGLSDAANISDGEHFFTKSSKNPRSFFVCGGIYVICEDASNSAGQVERRSWGEDAKDGDEQDENEKELADGCCCCCCYCLIGDPTQIVTGSLLEKETEFKCERVALEVFVSFLDTFWAFCTGLFWFVSA